MPEPTISFKLMDDVNGVGKRGQVVTMALAPQDTFVVAEIDTYLGGFSQTGDYRQDEVTPPILVEKEKFQYRNFTKNHTFKRVNVDASLMGAINEVDPETELKTGNAKHRALGSFVPAVTEAQSVFDYSLASASRIKGALDLDREIRLWTILTTLTNWNTANKVTLGATFNWNGGAASDPIFDLNQRKLKSAAKITDWWMSQEVADAFIRNPKVQVHMRQMLGDAAPSPQIVQQDRADFSMPGVGTVHVVSAKVLNETTGNLDEILTDTVVGTHGIPGQPRTGLEMASINTWRVRGPSGTGYISRQVFLSTRGYAGGTLLVVGHQEDVVMPSDIIGGVIADVIQ